MPALRDLLQTQVTTGSVPGAVGLVARGDHLEVSAVGCVDADGTAPMARDSIFRIASITKPITAAATMILVDDSRIALDDPVEKWLPELTSPSVVRTPTSPVDDVVPALRPITVFDLLTNRSGHGFPDDFTLPAVQPLFSDLTQGSPVKQPDFGPDEWMRRLSRIPLLDQPGESWLYNTGSDILGVLIARVSGTPLPEFLAERLFEPLGMTDTAFDVPAGKRGRFTSAYRPTGDGDPELVDPPAGQWAAKPAFPSGAGGLASTVDDWHAFARMLLDQGSANGRRILTPAAVRQLTTDHLTEGQRAAGSLFLEGQGWGFGGSVDVATVDPWNVPGRYGWVGGTGTAAHLTPSTGTISILMTQVEMTGPTPPDIMRAFWRYAATR
jgi:CubicO group peptidase (beta-lactamase class C family)